MLACYTCPVKRQKLLANVCLRCPKASVFGFGHLMAWMGPPVSCSWPVPLDSVGLRGPLPGTPISPPFYTPTLPCLQPASSSTLPRWETVTEPHCVWCGRTQTQPLFPFQKPQPSTWVIFLGIHPVKYLAGAGLKGQLNVVEFKVNKKKLLWQIQARLYHFKSREHYWFLFKSWLSTLAYFAAICFFFLFC